MANTITVITSFLLGHYIVEQEQQGQERAKYGSKVIDSLSSYLTKEYGRGFSRSNVVGMRQFYLAYKDKENEIIQSQIGQLGQEIGIVQSGIGQLDIVYSKLPVKLSWTHYQVLMRQYHSSLYESLAVSLSSLDVSEGISPIYNPHPEQKYLYQYIGFYVTI